MDLSGDVAPFQKLVAAAIVGTEEQAKEIILSGNVEEAEILKNDTAEQEEEAEWVREDSGRP